MLKSSVPPAEIAEGGERVTTESEWIGCFGAKRERSNCSKMVFKRGPSVTGYGFVFSHRCVLIRCDRLGKTALLDEVCRE